MHKGFHLTIISLIVFLSFIDHTSASIIDDLQQKITGKADQIKQLETEIKVYSQALDTTKKQSNTLKSEIYRIDLTRNKLSTDLKITDTSISKTALTINKLDYQIKDKQSQIFTNESAIQEVIRNIGRAESDNILELMASSDQLSDIVDKANTLDKLRQGLRTKTLQLKNLKVGLEHNKSDKEVQKKTLTTLKVQLAGQKQVVDQTKQEKDSLLKETKAKESNYQKLLNDRKKKMKEVQNEIASIEQQIKIQINPNLLPKTGSKTLSYPLSNIVITQTFGDTAFSRSKLGAVYNGNGHNGVDFGAKTGTSVKAAADGKVMGFGNTDLTCAGASYGKWILLEHNNGLSTLYAHLSVINVYKGQTVSSGDIIGLSGNTGYSTGPHLHFTVYATQGVHVGSLKSKVASCGTYTLPIASTNSYLNPLAYLPPK